MENKKTLTQELLEEAAKVLKLDGYELAIKLHLEPWEISRYQNGERELETSTLLSIANQINMKIDSIYKYHVCISHVFMKWDGIITSNYEVIDHESYTQFKNDIASQLKNIEVTQLTIESLSLLKIEKNKKLNRNLKEKVC